MDVVPPVSTWGPILTSQDPTDPLLMGHRARLAADPARKFEPTGLSRSDYLTLIASEVDFWKTKQDAEGAIIEAGRARLRPILMTALATIFALLPLALGLAGGGSQLISSSLALTVIGGLTTSTFLTLLVVPAGYSLLKDGRRHRKKKKYAGRG